MLRWIVASFAQLTDRRFLTVLGWSGLCAVIVFGGLWAVLDGLAAQVVVTGWPAWLASFWSFADDWIVALLTLALSFFLFTGVATAIMSLFLDSIVDAVEVRHYRGWRAPHPMGLGMGLRMGLASGARLVGWNLLLLPVYLALLVTAVGPLLLFMVVNGWLLGRDLLEMVLARHSTLAQARALVKANGGLAFGVGAVASTLLLVPFLGIIGPLIGAAVATHASHWLMAHAAAPSHSART